ncbi:kinase-like domain-containing protein [Aspergillus welwitschiae]|uniref:Kinase-like domain-containing protein n=1 Tax=Aspergillus welwitschiae TaxID=1341132 RepID=A0A3F3PHN8_9EURO|nr:kinase-like domain-containing protein [Aspergillus welwitschiae]RDH26439.1 kinase-like domain-containing protein [Aspergillus welwitschiae]
MAGSLQTEILGTVFKVTERYTDLWVKGLAASGLLCPAYDRIMQQPVTLRKISRPFYARSYSRNAFHEIVSLKHLRHSNVSIHHSLCTAAADKIGYRQDLRYVVSESSGPKLGQIMGTGRLDHIFTTYFLYQILVRLKYLHSASLYHCDLQPADILVNEIADLKIGNLDLDGLNPWPTCSCFIHHYQAPEVILLCQQLDPAVDIFSTGCILGEIFRGSAVFAGEDLRHQLELFVDILGSSPEQMLEDIRDKKTLSIIESLSKQSSHCSPHFRAFTMLYPNTMMPYLSEKGHESDTSIVVNLLEKILTSDPQGRLAASKALAHSHLARYYDPTDEPVAHRISERLLVNARLPGNPWEKMFVVALHTW